MHIGITYTRIVPSKWSAMFCICHQMWMETWILAKICHKLVLNHFLGKSLHFSRLWSDKMRGWKNKSLRSLSTVMFLLSGWWLWREEPSVPRRVGWCHGLALWPSRSGQGVAPGGEQRKSRWLLLLIWKKSCQSLFRIILLLKLFSLKEVTLHSLPIWSFPRLKSASESNFCLSFFELCFTHIKNASSSLPYTAEKRLCKMTQLLWKTFWHEGS